MCCDEAFLLYCLYTAYTGWAEKQDNIEKLITLAYDGIERYAVYQNFHFFIRGKIDILNDVICLCIYGHDFLKIHNQTDAYYKCKYR